MLTRKKPELRQTIHNYKSPRHDLGACSPRKPATGLKYVKILHCTLSEFNVKYSLFVVYTYKFSNNKSIPYSPECFFFHHWYCCHWFGEGILSLTHACKAVVATILGRSFFLSISMYRNPFCRNGCRFLFCSIYVSMPVLRHTTYDSETKPPSLQCS